MNWVQVGGVLADFAGTIFLALMLIAGGIALYDTFWSNK